MAIGSVNDMGLGKDCAALGAEVLDNELMALRFAGLGFGWSVLCDEGLRKNQKQRKKQKKDELLHCVELLRGGIRVLKSLGTDLGAIFLDAIFINHSPGNDYRAGSRPSTSCRHASIAAQPR